jgi:hypothetical protein
MFALFVIWRLATLHSRRANFCCLVLFSSFWCLWPEEGVFDTTPLSCTQQILTNQQKAKDDEGPVTED